MWFSLLLAVIQLLQLTYAHLPSTDRVLIISEDKEDRREYSQILSGLKNRGYEITFESPRNEKLSLYVHDQRAYDHLVIFPSKSKGLGPALTAKAILSFLNAKGNLLLLFSASSPTPTAINSVLQEVGIALPPDRASVVVDHFQYDRSSSGEQHDVILVPYPDAHRLFTVDDASKSATGKPLVAFPQGVAQMLSPSNPLLQSLLPAPRTSMTHNPKDEDAEEPAGLGSQLSLISTVQARNNARLTVVGAADLMKNAWLDAQVRSASGEEQVRNRALAEQLVSWTFQKSGVLRVLDVRHWSRTPTETLAEQGNSTASQAAGSKNPSIYRINQDVVFEVEIAELHGGNWGPPKLDASDEIQLEFSMLSPFHRIPLQATQPDGLSAVTQLRNSTTFRGEFKTPDQHGIFNFQVNYQRPFFSKIDVKERVTVRHMAHDEWPRSYEIRGSWVWIFGIGSVICGWLGFVSMWMYGDWSS